MKFYAISEVDRDALLQYLAKRPYEEVANAIPGLKNLPELQQQAQANDGEGGESA